MQKDKDKRRSFLKHVLAGAAVVVGGAAAIKPAKAGPVSQPKENNDILYQESENFKKYYESLK